jgi:stearoyl-CoA desaturase (delta-9 desaturase)
LLQLTLPGFAFWGDQWWKPLLFLVVVGHLTNACISLYLHRCQTHNSVELHRAASLGMRIWLWLSTSIKTREWVACHRKHHAFADREGDPHSPVREGLHKVVLGGYFYYRRAVRDPGVLAKYGQGTPNDWFERYLIGKLQSVGLLAMLLVDVYLFGPVSGSLVWLAQLLWVPLWAAGIVNGVGHAYGYRNFKIKGASRNIVPLAIWLGGEELHNNHHADPASARFQARWFEFDIGWAYLRLLSLFGLARVLRPGTPAQQPAFTPC